MSYIFLLGQGEESLAGSFSDIPVYVLSRSNPTAERFYSSGNGMGSCPDSLSGMTCGPSMAIPGEDESTSSAEDSHARTSPPQAKGLGSAENAADYGLNLLGSLAKFDRDSYSWRTPQCSLVEGLDEFSGTWPRWGTMRSGECWERIMPELPTSGTESGSWPTPRASEANGGDYQYDRGDHSKPRDTLKGMVKRFPSPAARDWKSGAGRKENGHVPQLPEVLGGQLNPDWVEWLMGWPIGWTACEPLEMGRYQQWPLWHSGNCPKD